MDDIVLEILQSPQHIICSLNSRWARPDVNNKLLLHIQSLFALVVADGSAKISKQDILANREREIPSILTTRVSESVFT